MAPLAGETKVRVRSLVSLNFVTLVMIGAIRSASLQDVLCGIMDVFRKTKCVVFADQNTLIQIILLGNKSPH